MTLKTCLRCDWQGETKEPACPNCGVPLYVLGASPSGEESVPAAGRPEERSREAASTPSTAPSAYPAPQSDHSPSRTDAVGSGRSDRPAVAFVVAGLVLALTLGTWLKAQEERSAPAAPADAAGRETPASDGSPSPVSPTPVGSPSPTPAGVELIEPSLPDRKALTVAGVPFSFRVPSDGWESKGSISINKSTFGSQGAEAIIFWTSFPDGEHARPCAKVLNPPVGPSVADLAAAVSTAPGFEGVTGPLNATVGGRAAKHVVLTVRENVGCDPGFFYSWHAGLGGAFWRKTGVDTTIRVWIVKVDGIRLFIEAATTPQADSELEQEIQQIVGSIRFD